jgi:transcriptional regulator with XRE-family HTH domain
MSHPLRAYRKAIGVTLEDMAGRIGISIASLSRIETGKQRPSLLTLLRIEDETGGAVGASAFRQFRADGGPLDGCAA